MARFLIISSTICYMWLAVCWGGASGTGNTHVKETHDFLTPLDGDRTRRDVMSEQVFPQRPNSISILPNGAGSERPDEDSRSSNSVNGNNNNGSPLNNGPAKQLVKRAPSGFTGMRGKKEYEFTDSPSNNAHMWNLLPAEHDAPTGYESIDLSGPNAERYKKTPNALYGVHGKKYSSDFSRLKEILARLEEQQIRESLLQQFLERVAASTVAQNEIAKRAPTGFTGMRGKRPFTGYFELEQPAIENEAELDKRGPLNGFLGVRGKKDVDHQNFKRSPLMSRTGKYPYFDDFRNKFVAVRGKKSDTESDGTAAVVDGRPSPMTVDVEIEDDDEVWRMLSGDGNVGGDHGDDSIVAALRPPGGGVLMRPRQRYFANTLPSLLFSYGRGSGGVSGKRAPNGFVGMRGKRAAGAPSQEAAQRMTSTAQ